MTSPAPFRRGARLGIDVGSVRVGIAVSDPDGRLAVPLDVVARDKRHRGDLAAISMMVAEREVTEIVVGRPRTLAGRDGPAVALALEYARQLAVQVAPVTVRLVDERLSTVEAARGLQAAGMSTRRARHQVDSAAAVVFLQAALDEERATGLAPGELVEVTRQT